MTKNMLLEPVRCNLCGSDNYIIHLIRKDFNLYVDGEFRLVKCNVCGLVYQNPRPSIAEFSNIYPEEYDQYTDNSLLSQSKITRLDRQYGLNKQAKAILQYKSTGKLLDIGCATGEFLHTIANLPNWEVYGVEPSSYAGNIASTRYDIDVKTGCLEKDDFPKAYFDVVTMWNVIEHLPDPKTSLEYIHDFLKEDGVLIFNTPLLESVDARIYKASWIGYELPRHFFVFSDLTIRFLLQEVGFEIIEVRNISGSHAASMSSLRFYLREHIHSRELLNSLEFVIFSRFLRIISFPYFYIIDRLLLSTAPTYFCKRL